MGIVKTVGNLCDGKYRSDNTVGIYCITNMVNQKKYIGQSVDIERRWHDHVVELKGNRHHSSHLQNSWNYYGQDAFFFSIVEECPEDKLTSREMFWMDRFNTLDGNFGYNMREAGSKGKLSEESKKKLSESQKGLFAGEKNPSSKITESDALLIIDKLLHKESVKDIVRETGFGYKTIYHIKRKETWTHLTKSIEFPCTHTSKYRGVTYDKGYKRWCARIMHAGRPVYIEYFGTEIEAAIARDKKALELYGDKAILNNITSHKTPRD